MNNLEKNVIIPI